MLQDPSHVSRAAGNPVLIYQQEHCQASSLPLRCINLFQQRGQLSRVPFEIPPQIPAAVEVDLNGGSNTASSSYSGRAPLPLVESAAIAAHQISLKPRARGSSGGGNSAAGCFRVPKPKKIESLHALFVVGRLLLLIDCRLIYCQTIHSLSRPSSSRASSTNFTHLAAIALQLLATRLESSCLLSLPPICSTLVSVQTRARPKGFCASQCHTSKRLLLRPCAAAALHSTCAARVCPRVAGFVD